MARLIRLITAVAVEDEQAYVVEQARILTQGEVELRRAASSCDGQLSISTFRKGVRKLIQFERIAADGKQSHPWSLVRTCAPGGISWRPIRPMQTRSRKARR